MSVPIGSCEHLWVRRDTQNTNIFARSIVMIPMNDSLMQRWQNPKDIVIPLHLSTLQIWQIHNLGLMQWDLLSINLHLPQFCDHNNMPTFKITTLLMQEETLPNKDIVCQWHKLNTTGNPFIIKRLSMIFVFGEVKKKQYSLGFFS